MGKLALTQSQKLVLDELRRYQALARDFYWTGGTALSFFYLQHRQSDDLDFFSEEELNDELLNEFVNQLSRQIGLKHRFTLIEETRVFEFMKKGKLWLKIDFAYYPYPRLNKGKVHQGISVDSLLDIAANKLLVVSQRSDIKDFVDLYFLLKKFTLWDLVYAVEKKFRRETDLLLLGADFLKTKEFDFLPKMIVPLQLTELQQFFQKKARETGLKATQ